MTPQPAGSHHWHGREALVAAGWVQSLPAGPSRMRIGHRDGGHRQGSTGSSRCQDVLAPAIFDGVGERLLLARLLVASGGEQAMLRRALLGAMTTASEPTISQRIHLPRPTASQPRPWTQYQPRPTAHTDRSSASFMGLPGCQLRDLSVSVLVVGASGILGQAVALACLVRDHRGVAARRLQSRLQGRRWDRSTCIPGWVMSTPMLSRLQGVGR